MRQLNKNIVLVLTMLFMVFPLKGLADTQFRVIVDASGSMVISDPDKLTSEALRLISNLAPEEKTTLGIWLFGEAPRVLLPEAPINKATKEKLASYVNNYVTQDLKTDLESILSLLLKTPDPGYLDPGFSRHWILVTDGMVDISLDEKVNQASRNRILNEITKQLEAKGVHLHTISMTGYTDKALLESLSLKTNATHTEVAVPEDLLDTFERIFNQASPSEELPIVGNDFRVDDAVKELTLVIFHEENDSPQIIRPTGTELPLVNKEGVKVAKAPHYTLVTIRKPESGTWQINNVDLERSSIRVVANLSAQATRVAPVIFSNEPIYSTVGLFQNGQAIKEDSILNLLRISQTLIKLNGATKEVVSQEAMSKAKDQFKHRIDGISQPGNYELVSYINGKTFARKLVQDFTVYPAISFEGKSEGNNLVALSAKPTNLKLNVMRSNVRLEITSQGVTQEQEEMPLIGNGYWEKVIPVSPDSHMKVRARLIGITQTGQRFEYWTPIWSIYRKGTEPPVVMKGDHLPPKPESNTPVLEDQEVVMPAVVESNIAEVTDVDDNGNEESNKSDAKADENSTVPEESEKRPEMASLTSKEWILYAILNVGGIGVLAFVVMMYRRWKRKKLAASDEIDDV